jgi:hypothetical protein
MRRCLIYKCLLGVVCICSLNCTPNRNREKDSSRNVSSSEEESEPDTCSFCVLNTFIVESMDIDIQTNINIDYPVAIETMDRVDLVRKYEDTNYDTLMKLFKMKHWGDRNEIYHAYDLFGYYTQGIKPILLNNSVTIIDTIKHEQYITILDGGKKYLIDLAKYRKEDGVLMFKPGKPPIYWNMNKEEENCYAYFGFPKWYFNCQ